MIRGEEIFLLVFNCQCFFHHIVALNSYGPLDFADHASWDFIIRGSFLLAWSGRGCHDTAGLRFGEDRSGTNAMNDAAVICGEVV